MARPRKTNEAELRAQHVGIQLTENEKKELRFRAAKTGRKLSDYCRIVLLSDHKAPAPSARSPEAIRELVVALNRVGNNVNQLAKVANETNQLPDRRALEEVTARIAETVEKVMAL